LVCRGCWQINHRFNLDTIFVNYDCGCCFSFGCNSASVGKIIKLKLNMFDKVSIRKPVYAGTWYSAEPDVLKNDLITYLKQAEVEEHDNKPRIVLVPHPGLVFGGKTQAYSYKALSRWKYRNVFIIGVSHRAYFSGISIGDYDYYETPLGNLKVNRDIVSFLMNRSSQFVFDKESQTKEHSLEVQMPFIRHIFGDEVSIIPIIMSGNDNEQYKYVVDSIYDAISDDDLIIISSDLSHYPKYDDAKIIDLETIQAFMSLNIAEMENKIERMKLELLNVPSTFACGEDAMKVAIYLSNRLYLDKVKLLHYENSGEAKDSDKEHVVGYASVVIFSSPEERIAEKLLISDEDKILALQIARKSIKAAFNEEVIEHYIPEGSVLNEIHGVFVTLRKNGELKGCVGDFEPNSFLKDAICEIAVKSAFSDSRFKALDEDELGDIEIEISVLSKLQEIESYKDFIPGKHGILIADGERSGTYLPQVAVEQEWNRDQMLENVTVEKAGLKSMSWKEGKYLMYTYTANVFAENEPEAEEL